MNSQRMEYVGIVLNTVMAMAEIAHGGQVIMDETSFGLIKSGLVQLHSRIAASPDFEALQNQSRSGLLPILMIRGSVYGTAALLLGCLDVTVAGDTVSAYGRS